MELAANRLHLASQMEICCPLSTCSSQTEFNFKAGSKADGLSLLPASRTKLFSFEWRGGRDTCRLPPLPSWKLNGTGSSCQFHCTGGWAAEICFLLAWSPTLLKAEWDWQWASSVQLSFKEWWLRGQLVERCLPACQPTKWNQQPASSVCL